MALSQEDLAILACPVCIQPLLVLANEAGLKCGVCKRVYPVRDEIPVMLADEATIVPD